MTAAGIYLYLSPKLPPLQELNDIQMQTPLMVYSRDNKLIGVFGQQKRIPILAEDIPEVVVKAFLAAEDDRFFEHSGVDYRGIARAVLQLASTGEIQGGGSTITMQVARNIYLHRGQTFTRKFSEILLSYQIEQQLSKDEIFQLYVNKIFLGKRAYGIEAAAEVYYGKHIEELNLAQVAMIAGLPKGPSIFNPIVNPERALIRRDWILGRMLELDYINATAYNEAIAQPVTASIHDVVVDVQAPYIAEIARQFAEETYGSSYQSSGYRIYTTIDSELQQVAQQSVIDGLDEFDSRKGYRGPETSFNQWSPDNPAPADWEPNSELWAAQLADMRQVGGKIPAAILSLDDGTINLITGSGEQIALDYRDDLSDFRRYISEDLRGNTPVSLAEVFAVGDVVRLNEAQNAIVQIPDAQAALVSISPNDGSVRALVGGYDYFLSKFNRALEAVRQPGSSFKPLIYTAALESGMTAATMINDSPVVIADVGGENIWRPTNDGGRFSGPIRLREALYRSRNMVSIRLVQQMGVNPTRSFLARFGFERRDLPAVASIALGSYATTPLKMAESYAVLANGGYHVQPFVIDRIEDRSGRTIFEHPRVVVCDTECERQRVQAQSTEEDVEALSLSDFSIDDGKVSTDAPRVVDERANFILDSILKDVIQRGTGRRARVLERPDIGGKTGTTNGPVDAWFSGYQRNVTTSVWVGYDSAQKLGSNEYGGSAALPIWINYMRAALQDEPVYERSIPDGVVSVRINPENGLRSHDNQNSVQEYFRREFLPEYESNAIQDIYQSDETQQSRDLEDIF
ncbi:PBP1A family penicillin-binding protein [uncultured Umboniibacter sp.]|uniref:penicillin-binding protein 1A n=1 Tax=uncultured Umboniibacter sp. TaxID=1798917 RepID=UPI00260CFB0C|nr:PBP1A family penicillin-binding protein [uncultured Umboniibacter sp.]